MATFVIEGGHKLHGSITPQGAKNEALQVLCAVILTKETVVINNLPNILDVNNLIDLLASIGVTVEKLAKGKYAFTASNLDINYLRSADFLKKCNKLRGSVMLIGPLLARLGEVTYAKPGGDKIGRRRLDTHFQGMVNLGATFTYDQDLLAYRFEGKKLKGTYMLLDEASVTGTANIIMASVMAEGTTTIYNAACEPYLQQLCKMLNAMGAKISGVGSNLLTIEGVSELHGAQHTLLPDMIEVGSFIGMAAITGSELRICNVAYKELGIIPDTFRKLGIQIDVEGDDIIIPAQEHYQIESFLDGSILTIADAPWPGLTPDLLSVLLVVATQAKGSVLIHQKMFESRLFFVDKLIDMGAQIILCDPHRAVVVGHDHTRQLKRNNMTSPDIRAGIAMLIAALSAIMPDDILASVEAVKGGADVMAMASSGVDIETVTAMASITNTGYIAELISLLFVFMIGGFLLYAAMYAAVGASVDSLQDAQQLTTPITLPIIIAFIILTIVMNDPSSPLVVWCSMIPFTSPIVMIGRIPSGIPTWEIVTSIVLLYSTFIVMVWLAGKIYRIGIFMHGKKPTLKDLYKWLKY